MSHVCRKESDEIPNRSIDSTGLNSNSSISFDAIAEGRSLLCTSSIHVLLQVATDLVMHPCIHRYVARHKTRGDHMSQYSLLKR